MATPSLADALPDFGCWQPPAFAAPEPAFPSFDDEAAPAPSNLPLAAPEAPDAERIVSEAVAAAEAALEERLRAEHESALDALRAAHADEVVALEAKLGGEAAEQISTALSEMEARIAGHAETIMAQLVAPLLSGEVQRLVLERLAASIAAAIADGDAARITVRGPQSLISALSDSMGENAARLHLVEAAGFEVSVSIGDSLMETRLSEWADALSGVMS